MAPKPRKVWKLPLTEIWNDHNVVVGTLEIRSLDLSDIETLFEQGTFQFVLVDFPYPYLQWLPITENGNILAELRNHLVTEAEFELDEFTIEDYKGRYCYTATQWETTLPHPLILLIKHH